MKNGLTGLLVLFVAGIGLYAVHPAWLQRFLPREEPPAAHIDVYATWVDADGVRHFSDQPREGGEKVVVDTGRIGRLEPLPPAEKPAQAKAAPDAAPADGSSLTRLSREMQEAQKKIREARMRQSMGEER